MTWYRIDDKSAFHAKVVTAGNAAWGAHVRMGAHASDHLSDGFVSDSVAKLIASPREIARLLQVGLLERVEGGYVIHDFLDYNPSQAEVLAERERKAVAGKKGAALRWQNDAKPMAPAIAAAMPLPLEEACSRPDPVPIPSQSQREETTNTARAPLALDVSDARPGKSRRSGAHRSLVSADWQPSAGTLAALAKAGIPEAVSLAVVSEFVDYWTGEGQLKADWDATFRNRVRELEKSGRLPSPVLPQAEPRNERGETSAEETARWRREVEEAGGAAAVEEAKRLALATLGDSESARLAVAGMSQVQVTP